MTFHQQIPEAPEKVVRALRHTRSLLKPGGHLLVTVPTGYNPALDEGLRRAVLEIERAFASQGEISEELA